MGSEIRVKKGTVCMWLLVGNIAQRAELSIERVFLKNYPTAMFFIIFSWNVSFIRNFYHLCKSNTQILYSIFYTFIS